MFIESSKDILYLVIAFCILWITIFTAWFIYYLAMIMRQVLKMIKDARAKFKKVDDAIQNFKEKLELSAVGLSFIGDGIKKIIEIAKEKNEAREKKNKKKK